MKKISLFLFVMVLIYVPSVLATSGALRKDSIITCNGVTYGQHGSDNHWHVATVNSDGKYYASGEAIYSNPCSNSVSSNSTASSSSSAKTSTSSSNVQNNPT